MFKIKTNAPSKTIPFLSILKIANLLWCRFQRVTSYFLLPLSACCVSNTFCQHLQNVFILILFLREQSEIFLQVPFSLRAQKTYQMCFLSSDILVSKILYQSYICVCLNAFLFSSIYFSAKQCNNLPENQNTSGHFQEVLFPLLLSNKSINPKLHICWPKSSF